MIGIAESRAGADCARDTVDASDDFREKLLRDREQKKDDDVDDDDDERMNENGKAAHAANASKLITLRESLQALDSMLRRRTETFEKTLLTMEQFVAPRSLTEAIGQAQEKQQIKKNDANSEREEDRVKHRKQDYLQDEMQRWVAPVGASLADAEQGPFIAWCEEHFREVTVNDARKLIPSEGSKRLDEDPDFAMPEMERSYAEEWEKMDRKMKAMDEENRIRARELARQESFNSKQKKKEKSKDKFSYLAGAKTVKDDAEKFIITRISPIPNLKEIGEYCGVCFDGESYEEDPIIFCDNCEVAVHLTCYGLQKIPEGDWLCRACSTKSEKGNKKQCCLCTISDGALKPTRDNRWAHLFCAQWIPELFISNTKAMEPIENMNKLVKERLSMNCVVCKTRNEGACIQCAYGNCTVPVHPMCAVTTGMRMEVRTEKKKEEVVDYRVYCEKHAALLDKAAKVVQQQQDQKGGKTASSSEQDDEIKKETNGSASEIEKENDGKENKKGSYKSSLDSSEMKKPSTPSNVIIAMTTPTKSGATDEYMNKLSRDDVVSPMPPAHGPADSITVHMERALDYPAPGLPTEINEFLMDEGQDAQIAIEKMKANSKRGDDVGEKCAICLKQKKGTVCGTATAPLKCLRRKGNLETLRKEMENDNDTTSKKSDPAYDPDIIRSPKEELERLNNNKHLFEKIIPDDEVTAELLRSQAALARLVNITRTMANKLLQRIEDDKPNVQARLEKMERTVKDVESYENRYRGGRWRIEKLRSGGQLPALADGGDGTLESLNEHGMLVDPLCTIVAMEDALCCVCTGGESEPPNEIMFCERCEVAVHQDCYGVGEIPDGDWLCWPCQIVEDRERETNAPRTRPPRYMREAGDGLLYDPRVKCELCPIMRGAMRAIVPAKFASPLSEMKVCASIPGSQRATPKALSSLSAGNVDIKMEHVDDDEIIALKEDTNMTDIEPETEKQETPNVTIKKEMGTPSLPESKEAEEGSKAAIATSVPTLPSSAFGDTPANLRPHKLKWAHVVCAKWMPGISCDLFSNEPEAVRGEDSIPSRLFQATCAVCNSKDGAKVQCSKENCRMFFHPLCARRGNYFIEYGPQNEGTPVAHYCRNHSTQAKRDAGRNIKPVKFKGTTAIANKAGVKRRPPTAEEITLLKRARVGLETLRLLCERVNKREKIRRDELESLGTLWKAQIRGEATGPILKPGELEAAEDLGFIRQGPAVLYLTDSLKAEAAALVPQGYEFSLN